MAKFASVKVTGVKSYNETSTFPKRLMLNIEKIEHIEEGVERITIVNGDSTFFMSPEDYAEQLKPLLTNE